MAFPTEYAKGTAQGVFFESLFESPQTNKLNFYMIKINK